MTYSANANHFVKTSRHRITLWTNARCELQGASIKQQSWPYMRGLPEQQYCQYTCHSVRTCACLPHAPETAYIAVRLPGSVSVDKPLHHCISASTTSAQSGRAHAAALAPRIAFSGDRLRLPCGSPSPRQRTAPPTACHRHALFCSPRAARCIAERLCTQTRRMAELFGLHVVRPVVMPVLNQSAPVLP